jgi:hypothetical protein
MSAFLLILIAIPTITLIFSPSLGIMIGFVVRPVLDCFYDTFYEDYPLTKIMGAVFVAVLLCRLFATVRTGFRKIPLAGIWFIWFYMQLFNTCFIVASGDGLTSGMDFLLRGLHGFVGYFMLQTYFREREQFRRLLIALLIAGIFPLSMSVYQNLLGGAIKTEETVGGVIRNIGLYHDAFTLRLYAFQTLTAAILFGATFVKDSRIWCKSVLLLISILSIITIYKLFSKAGYVILTEFAVTWNLLRKNYLTMFACTLILAVGLVAASPALFHKVHTVYSKEVALIKGKGDLEHTFQGRWYLWKPMLAKWAKAPFYRKLVGDGSTTSFGSHNEFLRTLFSTGALGLLILLVLLSMTFRKIVLRCISRKSPLDAAALMLFLMWFVDALGLVPGAYTGYQLFVWGFIGLSVGAGEAIYPKACECPDAGLHYDSLTKPGPVRQTIAI